MAKPAAAKADAPEPDALVLGALSEVLGFHVAQAAVFTVGLFDKHVGRPFGLRKTEYSLLLLLLANGPLPPKRLAQALVLSAPNLTMLLDRLQGRGLLRRERSQTDRRSQFIVLTAEGERVARASGDAAGTMERETLVRLSPAEHAMLIELLGKVAGR